MLTERQKEIISVLRSELQSNSSKELKKADSTYASELRHLLTQCLEASSYNWRPLELGRPPQSLGASF